jgi:hypothetical protein
LVREIISRTVFLFPHTVKSQTILKVRLASPKYTLSRYAESAWFLNSIDGRTEHQRLELEKLRSHSQEKFSHECVEAELVDSGEIISVSGSSGSAIERVFEGIGQNQRHQIVD